MEGNKEIEAVAAHVDDDKDLEGAQPKEEEVAYLDEEEVAVLVDVIGSEVAESVHLRQISNKEDGPTIVMIPRVPDRLRKGKEDAFEPSIVSIGPYHIRKPGLEHMQKHKRRFLQKILDRNPKRQLNEYVRAITQLAEQAQRCYEDDLESMGLTREEFVQMLLLDGCFLVELFLPVVDHTEEKEDFFSVEWRSSQVLSDLLILENQIPFFILQRIYELATPSPTTHDPPPFTQIAINVCNLTSHFRPKRMRSPPAAEIHHFLHLYHMHTLWPLKED